MDTPKQVKQRTMGWLQRYTATDARLARWLLPNGGTILIVLALVLTSNVWARSAPALSTATNSVTRLVPYQGRLGDSAGVPLTGVYPMIFRFYSSPEPAAIPLWEEQWTGSNSVQVSDGLFNVMLGSLNAIPQSIVTDNNALWLGITVSSDDEMSPRVQVGSVVTALYAQEVSPNSISSAHIQDQAILPEDLDASAFPPGVPIGTVISWWRADTNTPLPSDEWMVADGSVVNDPESPLNGESLPDLTNRFIMGVGSSDIGTTGGSNTQDLTHNHSIPGHTHNVSGSTTGADHAWDGGYFRDEGHYYRYAVQTYQTTWYYAHSHSVNLNTSEWNGNTNQTSLSADNRPAYVGMIYLVRIK